MTRKYEYKDPDFQQHGTERWKMTRNRNIKDGTNTYGYLFTFQGQEYTSVLEVIKNLCEGVTEDVTTVYRAMIQRINRTDIDQAMRTPTRGWAKARARQYIRSFSPNEIQTQQERFREPRYQIWDEWAWGTARKLLLTDNMSTQELTRYRARYDYMIRNHAPEDRDEILGLNTEEYADRSKFEKEILFMPRYRWVEMQLKEEKRYEEITNTRSDKGVG